MPVAAGSGVDAEVGTGRIVVDEAIGASIAKRAGVSSGASTLAIRRCPRHTIRMAVAANRGVSACFVAERVASVATCALIAELPGVVRFASADAVSNSSCETDLVSMASARRVATIVDAVRPATPSAKASIARGSCDSKFTFLTILPVEVWLAGADTPSYWVPRHGDSRNATTAVEV